MSLPQIGEVKRLIQANKLKDARDLLRPSLNDDMRDPNIWVLAARLAASVEERQEALRKVFEYSEKIEQSDWALEELQALSESGKTHLLNPPPDPYAASVNLKRSKPQSVALRIFRLGLLGFFLGLFGVCGIGQFQERGIEAVETQRALYLIPYLKASVIFFWVSVVVTLGGLSAVLIGMVGFFMPRYTYE